MMNDSRRRIAGIAALLVVLVSLTALATWRVRSASRLGWAGFTYVPLTSKQAQKVPAGFGFKAGGVIMVYPGGPAQRAGITQSDQVVAINGIPANDIKRLSAVAEATHAGDVVRYTMKRGATTRAVAIRFERPTRSVPMVSVLAINIVVGLTFLVIGLFVFIRRPSDARAVVFYAMTLTAAASFIGGALSSLDVTNIRGIVVETSVANAGGLLIVVATLLFFAPLLLHLALIFPVERPVMVRRRRTVLQWIYGVPAFIIVCGGLLLAVFAALQNFRAANNKAAVKAIGIGLLVFVCLIALIGVIRIVMRLRRTTFREAVITSPFEMMMLSVGVFALVGGFSSWLASRTNSPGIAVAVGMMTAFGALSLLSIYPISTIVSLYRNYRDAGVEQRRQVKWPLWGTIVAVVFRIVMTGFGLVMGALYALGHDFRFSTMMMIWPELVVKIIYTLIPLSFAFAILKYRLMNIDVIIRRTVLYTMLTGVIFVLYAILVAGLGTALVTLGGVKNQTVLIASTAVIAIVAVPLRNRLQQLVDRNLFRERRDYPLALRNLGNAIATSTAVDAFLKYAAEQLQQALQNRFVLLAVRRDREYVAAAKVGIADEILGSLRIPADAMSFDNNTMPESLRRLGTAMTVPIAAHREPTGFLALGSRLSDEDFSPQDAEFILAAAAQIAVGIENVRLRDEEADFEQARAMQQILLPKSIPQVPGFEITGLWQPSRSVGGDYFDVLALGNGRIGICIADVAGKGMPAALLMANLQAAVKASASRDASPAAVVERVKTIVCGNLAGGKFISFFYGVLDAPARTLTYTNAGHNPPIVARSGAEIERLMRGGPAVCRLFQDAIHEQEAIELRSGDRVILFTDGVSEARRGEEEFGEDRLIQLVLTNHGLTAKALEEKILGRLRDFTAGEFSDDVTMIVIAADPALASR